MYDIRKVKYKKGFEIVGESRDNLIVIRPDGLKIFLNDKDDERINQIRLHHPDKKYVMLTVGLYRGLQVARNYKERYAADLKVDYMKFTDNLLKSGGMVNGQLKQHS